MLYIAVEVADEVLELCKPASWASVELQARSDAGRRFVIPSADVSAAERRYAVG